jgi:hypothetical protein
VPPLTLQLHTGNREISDGLFSGFEEVFPRVMTMLESNLEFTTTGESVSAETPLQRFGVFDKEQEGETSLKLIETMRFSILDLRIWKATG